VVTATSTLPTGRLRRLRSALDRPVVVAALLAVTVVLVALAPDPVPLGGARLLARVALVAGAAVTIARARAVDLGVAAVAGVGAVVGGVLPAVAGLPALAGVPLGAAAGALLGGVNGAVQGRAGRQLGALATLAIGAATVQVLGTLEVVGGVVGFHAVGLPTGAGDRADVLVVGAVTTAVVAVASWAGRTRRLAAAALGTADPAVAASLGRSPVVDVAVAGAIGGSLLGVGATLLASVDGSVVPAAYGLELAAALVVAAAVGGAGPLGSVVGTLLVWGPATLFPLAPVVGTWPVLVTAGPIALTVLAVRGGRALLPFDGGGRTTRPDLPAATVPPDPGAPTGPVDATGAGPPPRLQLLGTSTPSGELDLDVAAGELVALVGPNGAGKSTLLARIGGQLPDGGTVLLDGHPLPHGARRRARRGVARTWQRPPDVAVGDAAAAASVRDPAAGAATAARLGAGAGSPGGAQLVRLAASQPRVALLDEPTDLDPTALAPVLRDLADAGAAVLVVDHRPEVAAVADRVVSLGLGTEQGA
jgi:branched-chain amino acid transport system permease protein